MDHSCRFFDVTRQFLTLLLIPRIVDDVLWLKYLRLRYIYVRSKDIEGEIVKGRQKQNYLARQELENLPRKSEIRSFRLGDGTHGVIGTPCRLCERPTVLGR